MFKRTYINNQIRAKEVRVIDETGNQLGVMEFQNALSLAIERNLDLIQVTEKVDPPVCKLGDYGKYQYSQEKREKAAKKQKGGELKGIRLTFNISRHDLETRAHVAEKFLNKGDIVMIELPLKGRQKALHVFAKGQIDKFLEILGNIMPLKIERPLKKEGRGFTIIVSKS